MSVNKALIALALGLALAACARKEQVNAPVEPSPAATAAQGTLIGYAGQGHPILRTEKPDEYGVVCYRDDAALRNLSCVKVTGLR